MVKENISVPTSMFTALVWMYRLQFAIVLRPSRWLSIYSDCLQCLTLRLYCLAAYFTAFDDRGARHHCLYMPVSISLALECIWYKSCITLYYTQYSSVWRQSSQRMSIVWILHVWKCGASNHLIDTFTWWVRFDVIKNHKVLQ